MRPMIANFNLIPNMSELITPENSLNPELQLTAHTLQACCMGSLITKADFREFIVRICLHYGLLNPQETYFEKDHILMAELKENGEMVGLDPKKLIRFIGLIAIEGRLESASREVFLESLITGQRSSIWIELFSPFKIHRWEDRKNLEGEVIISVKENTPDISPKHISNAEAFADYIVKNFDEDTFQCFKTKNRPIIKAIQRMEYEIGTIKFDIKSLSKDFLKTFIIALRGEEFFDEKLFENYDEDEYEYEFKLMKLAWAVANGYAEYEYYGDIPCNLLIDPRVDFNHDGYEGMMNDDIGGVNLLQTYVDYELESVVYCLQNIIPLIEKSNE